MTCRPDSKIYAEAPTKEIKKEKYIMATKFKCYSQEKSIKNIKSSVFSGFMYIVCSHQKA